MSSAAAPTTTTTTTSNNATATTTSATTATPTSSSSDSSSITYSSTRGGQVHVDFRSVVMHGLATDRGLFVPDVIPTITTAELQDMSKLSYVDLAIQVLRKFVQDDQIPLKDLTRIVHASYGEHSAFRSSQVTPLVFVNGHAILELFHGPTFAFKDVALQLLGNIFEYFLQTSPSPPAKEEEDNKDDDNKTNTPSPSPVVMNRLAILGATSGDTGSAAIYGLRKKQGMDCIMLFPHQRVSPLQERQMTTVLDSNIHCVAIQNGTFDDCQDIVKNSFGNVEFRNRVHLGAVNSINWCRVLAQTTYYFWSYFRVQEYYQQTNNNSPTTTTVSFSVPTGNFGDVLAGYYAKQMGLPIDKLIVATNENDILHRFFTKGEYHRHDIQDSISPSMDICVSSNLERYLYHLSGNSPTQLKSWMDEFEQTHQLTITNSSSDSSDNNINNNINFLQQAQRDFISARADTAMTLQIMQEYYTQHQYLLCPHSAVGVSAIHQLNMVQPNVVCLATAHAGKFPAAVAQALEGVANVVVPPPPPQLAALESLPTKCALCPNDATVVQAFMEQRIQERIQAEEEAKKEKVKEANTTTTTTTSWRQQVFQEGYGWIWTAAVVGTAALIIQSVMTKKK